MSRYEGHDRRTPDDKWHVGKEIPLAVLIMLALQTGGGVWWAATMSQKIDSMIETVAEIKAERYTKEDAKRDLDLVRLRSENLSRRVDVLETYHRQK